MTIARKRRISTLVDLFEARAEELPAELAYSFLADGKAIQASLTFAELAKGARAIGAELAARGLRGERAVLLFPAGLAFPRAFLGALWAGAVPVPAPPPEGARSRRTLPRLRAILEDARPAVVLTIAALAPAVREGLAAEGGWLAGLPILATDEIPDEGSEGSPARPSGSDLAYLQYTSGSTREPRGVAITHQQVLANLEALADLYAWQPGDRAASWMPSFHDFGLVEGLLGPAFAGVPAYLLSPLTFLKRPLRWLELISSVGITHSSGPTFAFEHCTGKVSPQERDRLDLSSWRLASVGAEPVRKEVLESFAGFFAPCGFRRSSFMVGYGLAEATLVVTGRRPDAESWFFPAEAAALERQNQLVRIAEGSPRWLASCGVPVAGAEVCIVDPERRELPAGAVGEIWVKAPFVGDGYFGREEESEGLFRATLADGRGTFLRTGDLGALLDGELFVTGRIKDLIIVRGQNHYPHDIESSIRVAHPEIQLAAALSVESSGEERLALVCEVGRDADEASYADLLAGIRETVLEHHELPALALALVRSGTIPRTSSGKVQRSLCRDLLLREELPLLARWREEVEPSPPAPGPTVAPAEPPAGSPARPAQAAIEAWLVERVAQEAQVEANLVGRDQPLARLGLDSLATVMVIGDLETWLGRKLSATLAWEYPTIAALAAHLGGEEPPPAAPVAAPVPSAASPAPREAAAEPHRAAPEPVAVAPPAVAKEAPCDHPEPIAVIGLACRVPGAASPEELWQLLIGGVDAVSGVPPGRWDLDAYSVVDPETLERKALTRGGFLPDIEGFDAPFFGISPREAVAMDPQHRLVLEVAWEALERSGLAPASLAGSRTGVFVGISSMDYSNLQAEWEDPGRVEMYRGIGAAACIAANRISYLLGLHGPSLAVDTACSSSLVATHLACQSLRQAESDLALVAGVNLLVSPTNSLIFVKARMLADDGRCKTFDAAADGYVRGEGAGVVVLKRLSDARRDGDHVHAVIRGSAVNQDGLSNGLTAPNAQAQKALVREALAAARLVAEDIAYVEAHGTGTSLGDPIEAQALAASLCAGRSPDRPLWIGSLKTNLGHLEAGAGIAGLIKLVLSVERGLIPPHLHFRTPSPHITWDQVPLAVPTAPMAWPVGYDKRRGGVSSFGFGGTNSHVLVEEPPEPPARPAGYQRPVSLLVLSAKTATALATQAERWARHFEEHPFERLADAAHTAAVGRAHFEHRLAVVAPHGRAAAARLRSAAGITGRVSAGASPRVAVLFSGQGTQLAGTGAELYAGEPRFRQALDEAASWLLEEAGWDLRQALFAGDGRLVDTELAQPTLFAVGYALWQLYRAWGLPVAAVLGHSVGEYVAACAAGILPWKDGLRLVALRGRLMQATAPGRMVAVEVGEAEARAALAGLEEGASVAAINGQESVVISGEPAAVEGALGRLGAARVKDLGVNRAFHSPLMASAAAELERAWAAVGPLAPPQIELIWNLTARPLAPGEAPSPSYWRRQLLEPVRFADSVDLLLERGITSFVELGLTPALLPAVSAAREGLVTAASLRRGKGDWESVLEGVARLWTAGVELDLGAVVAPGGHRRVELPTYPWEHQRYWIERGGKAAGRARPSRSLAGERLASPLPAQQFHTEVKATDIDALREHRLRGEARLPLGVLAEAVLGAWATASAGGRAVLRDLRLEPGPALEPEGTLGLATVLEPAASGSWNASWYRRPAAPADGAWQLLGSARVVLGEPPPVPVETLEGVRTRLAGDPLPVERLRSALEAGGHQLGPLFDGWRALFARPAEALAEIDWRGGGGPLSHQILDPALLEAAELLALALPGLAGGAARADLAVAAGSLEARLVPGGPLWLHARLDGAGSTCALTAYDPEGSVVLRAEGVELGLAGGRPEGPAERPADWLYQLTWVPHCRPELAEETLEASFLPAPSVLADWLAEEAGAVLPDADREALVQLRQELEAVSAGFAREAVEALLGPLVPGRELRWPGLAEGLGVPPARHRLFGRLLEILTETGTLVAMTDHLRVETAPPREAASDQLARLRARHPASAGELELLARCAGGLAGVLRDELDPLDLLFPNGDLTLAEHLYRSSPLVTLDNALLTRLSAEVAKSLPAGRPLTVLEIGAGTGAATASILPALPAGRTEYFFTDVSQLFLSKAQARLGTLDGLRFRLLDIESEPGSQGLAPGRFDLVIAANVLHATADLGQSLDHARQLLAPGGLLVLLEGTARSRFLDLIFGLTDGWWRFRDEVRGSYPLLLSSHWLELLAATGFSEAAAFPPPGAPELPSRQALLFARAPLARPATPVPRLAGSGRRWLLLADRGGVAEGLATELAAAGEHPLLAAPGEAVEAALARLGGGEGLGGIVDLRPLDLAVPRDLSPQALTGELEPLLMGQLAALRRLAAPSSQAVSGEGRLWIVTRGCQGGEEGRPPLDPGPAASWGLGAVIAQEQPEHWGGLIDLGAETEAAEARRLAAELLAPDGEDRLRLASGGRWAARLQPLVTELPADGAPAFDGAASYLITGGFGGLGLAVAGWLVEHGARHLALVGRRAPSAEAEEQIHALRQRGATVLALEADVGDEAALTSALARVDAELPRLAGVIHSVGLLADALATELDLPRLSAVLAPKVRGAWQLHRATRDQALDFFILFSSAASLLGSAGQANHGAANAYLDALARYRRGLGLPAVAIDWGPWGEIGEARERGAGERFGRRGMGTLSTRGGLEALARVLESGAAQVGVLAIDRSRMAADGGKVSPLLADLLQKAGRAGGTAPEERGDLLAKLRAGEGEEPLAGLRQLVLGEVGTILGLGRQPAIGLGQGFFDLGMDSLTALELKNRLQAQLGRSLTSTAIFDHPNVEALTRFLGRTLLGLEVTEPPPPSASPLERVEELSDEAVEELLSRHQARVAAAAEAAP
ncbi:MAG TPA: SDR family NAD(P)-dependent oxidoreductase [Thermoanaerobaculia bacterium]|nr:SDR family NAD(P)-dependent oxidoreductase [Thermoanaerobaculia bacterium]